jgi:DNA-directed RNA polymerase subunit RPC12/RpoP
METRKCPDCKMLVQVSIQLIDEQHPEDGEGIMCNYCGYCFEYLEDERQRNWNRFKIESKIIKSLWKT